MRKDYRQQQPKKEKEKEKNKQIHIDDGLIKHFLERL